MSKKKINPKKADTRMPLTSADVNCERMERLRELFPEAVSDGKIDLERLGQVLGDEVDDGRERYGLSWAGKGDAIRAIQVPSVGTLIPCPDESVDFDTTENLFIEGDNLEVLKLLQKSYHGKVKMIYIDPPYNTGNEFIYPDNFRDGLQEYLRFTGQVDGEGVKLSTNRETSGRYHSNWLSMMYPRLFLARNLLKDDGVIFVSIDDHEVHNLRLLMDEIYGEENILANVIWQHSVQPKGYTEIFSIHHNHILCYRKSDKFTLHTVERTEKDNKNYSNPDNDPNGPWRSGDVRNALFRPNLIYEISTPSGKIIQPPANGWRWSKKTLKNRIATGEILFNEDETRIIRKIYLKDQTGRAPETIWLAEDVGSTREAAKNLKNIFDGEVPFDTSKPVRLIQHMMQIAGLEFGDIILDFFSGAGPVAEAVIKSQNDWSCHFIIVQLPEPINNKTPHGKVAEKLALKTISEIGKERIRRVIKRIKEEDEGQLDLKDREKPEDLGFKVFKLSSSNFKIWEAEEAPKDEGGLAEQLELYADHVLPDRSDQDILFELLLKAGRSLTAKIEQKKIEGKMVYSIEDGSLLICLEERVTAKAMRGMVGLKPRQVICLDNAFGRNDQLKTNTVLEMRDHDIEFRTV
jgi:adenine-specific DNA-methyltransferase